MIAQYTITGAAWVAISTIGQSGTAWLDEDNDGAGGQVDVRIVHSDSGVPASGETTEGKRIYKPSGNSDIMLLSADDVGDIFYAKCRNANDTAIISADMV